jgi:crossover junction endodeoxyribonuclease RuvC
MQVKEAVAGHGGAGKAQVGRMVRTLLRVDALPGPDDTADACAVAITHLHRARMGGALQVAANPGSNGLARAIAIAQAQARAAAGR